MDGIAARKRQLERRNATYPSPCEIDGSEHMTMAWQFEEGPNCLVGSQLFSPSHILNPSLSSDTALPRGFGQHLSTIMNGKKTHSKKFGKRPRACVVASSALGPGERRRVLTPFFSIATRSQGRDLPGANACNASSRMMMSDVTSRRDRTRPIRCSAAEWREHTHHRCIGAKELLK